MAVVPFCQSWRLIKDEKAATLTFNIFQIQYTEGHVHHPLLL
jgi:hypothetical protein